MAEAANDVQSEANDTGADDQSGDQQGPNDENDTAVASPATSDQSTNTDDQSDQDD